MTEQPIAVEVSGADPDRVTVTINLKDLASPDLRALAHGLGLVGDALHPEFAGGMKELAAFAGVMRASGLYAASRTRDAEHAIFKRGDPVEKIKGDYLFPGHVVAVVVKLNGALRYVVEDDRKALHIFSGDQLGRRDTSRRKV